MNHENTPHIKRARESAHHLYQKIDETLNRCEKYIDDDIYLKEIRPIYEELFQRLYQFLVDINGNTTVVEHIHKIENSFSQRIIRAEINQMLDDSVKGYDEQEIDIKEPLQSPTNFMRFIGTKRAESIANHMVELANKQDFPAMSYVLDRLIPKAQNKTSIKSKALLNVRNERDINEAFTLILDDIAHGKLSLEDAQAIASVLKDKSSSLMKAVSEEVEEIRERYLPKEI